MSYDLSVIMRGLDILSLKFLCYDLRKSTSEYTTWLAASEELERRNHAG